MTDQVIIAVDALGGDNGITAALEGVEQALVKDENLTVLLCGPEEGISDFVQSHARCQAVFTTEEITMGEHPANAVRTKKDSSLVVAAHQVHDGAADGFFSAGSTGACLAAGTLIVGRIKGVKRPALTTVVPSPIKECVLCDVGANADCKPEYILQFAQMASIYAHEMLHIEEPRVGLLNIGEEEDKGSQLAQQAYKLMQENLPNFAGNAEGRDVMAGTFDVIVTDGFTGNVCLKTLEGTSKVLFKTLKQIMMSSIKTKLAAAALSGDLKVLMQRINPDRLGGAPLLGLKGACFVGHGSSGGTAIANGILAAADYVRCGVSEYIAQTVKQGD